MFTGLIEEIGTIQDIRFKNNTATITISANKILLDAQIGDSISVNGACQTITNLTKTSFTVFASSETLNITNFKSYKIGTNVNLERAMSMSERLGGHIVTGHIDSLCKLVTQKHQGDAIEYIFEFDSSLRNQIVKKGSVSLNGISLTVANINDNTFSIVIIPHTLKNTTLQYIKIGEFVNLETDILGKYVEKYLSSNNNNSNITLDLLERNGFL